MLQTENDKNDIKTDLMNRLKDQACRIMAFAKEKQTNIECVIYVDRNGNDAVAYVYDSKPFTMTATTTFDKLAQDNYGNPDLGPIISYYNKIQFEHNVPAGTEIKIPILTRQEQNLRNRIYASPQMHDNYGRDMAIDDDGDFAVSGGDFAVVSGVKNLNQAMNNRLSTAVEKRIRVGVYGIRAAIGDPLAVDSYLLGSIERTFEADPRVDEIEEITFEGRGDALFVMVYYTDINGNKNTYQGEI
ncbi:MAG: hypothetical protein FWB73_00435 [Treponema sp.]|nr:hypothetical protein [Treponema sp.]